MKKEKKPVYEAPKIFTLDDNESVYGGFLGSCIDGSGDSEGCNSGNSAEVGCMDGNSAVGRYGCSYTGNSPTVT